MRKTKLNFIVLFMFIATLCTACNKNQTVEVVGTNVATITSSEDKNGLEVHFIDVGQADAILIEESNHYMLIDAGGNATGTKLQKYLEDEGVTELDYAIGTHPHEDHIGGLDVILYKFPTHLVMLSDYILDTRTCEDVYNVINERGYNHITPTCGQEYVLGNATFTIVTNDDYCGSNPNNFSIGVRLEYGDTSYLFCGDMETDAFDGVIEKGINVSADVFKLNHHGSYNGLSEYILDTINPTYGIVSCGKENEYGHPHESVMSLLANRNVSIFRTDLQGTIVSYSDGKNITWNVESCYDYSGGEMDNMISDNEADYTFDQNFILNENSKKIHLPTCESVNSMSEKNKTEYFGLLEEITKAGYEKCQNCF